MSHDGQLILRYTIYKINKWISLNVNPQKKNIYLKMDNVQASNSIRNLWKEKFSQWV